MSDPNDNILPFPYKGTMIVVLLNQLEDRYHHRCEVEYSRAPAVCGGECVRGRRLGDGETHSSSQLNNLRRVKCRTPST